jgi:FlaA1/EpsC-like NDP-sugar epimerase/lipopolysaccharide/colanic/teichoic acid biosynthesis glycosyltransferase
MLKRLIDILLSLVGIILFAPFFPVIVLIIKLGSRGPVFYLCDRLGKDEKLFKMYKFRTMYTAPAPIGPSVCPQGDPRVTPVGRFLRRTKLNELPQLLNILKGEMTFVGPRPESPDLAARYPEPARAIFTITPGLVGPNQILGRNEEEWYPPDVDPQQYYIATILPKKLPLDLEYVRHSSVSTDLKYLFLGVKETIFKVVNWNLVLQNRSQLYLLVADVVLCLVSYVSAPLLRFAGVSTGFNFAFFFHLLPVVIVARLVCFVYFGLYGTLIRYLSFHDIIVIIKGVSVSSLLLVSLTFLFDFRSFPRTVFFLDWVCLILLMVSLRIALRHLCDWHDKNQLNEETRVLIFGAGDAGALAYRSLMAEKENAFTIVGFLDDDPAKRHKTLYGKKVLGNRYTIEAVVKLYQVHEIFLAIPSAPTYEIDRVIQACQHAGVRYRVFPTLKDATLVASLPVHDVPLATLLKTQDVRMDTDAVRTLLQGKSVLVTGSCDALGLELCRQILRFSPHKLVIIDRYESYLSELVARLLNTTAAELIVPVLCSPINNEEIARVFEEHQPRIVFHTATRKYAPFFDIKVEDIVRVNYLSTFALAKEAARCGCEYFVMVSSEEAAKRGNSVSDSLRAAEISLRQFFSAQQTKLVITRLCDILENRGSMVSLLQEQIAHQEPVTLPSPNAKGHFLSKRAAAHFILQTLVLANSDLPGEGIFVCEKGEPITLMEVVSKLRALNGRRLASPDLQIKFLNGNTPDDDLVAVAGSHPVPEILLPVGHTHIRLLHDAQLPNSPEVSMAIHHIFDLQEQDLGQTAWKEYTRNLLRLASAC